MDAQRAKASARRLLKSFLRGQIIASLLEEDQLKWLPAVAIEDGIHREAMKAWAQVLSASTPDQLQEVVRQAFEEALREVPRGFTDIVPDEWITQRMAQLAYSFRPQGLLSPKV